MVHRPPLEGNRKTLQGTETQALTVQECLKPDIVMIVGTTLFGNLEGPQPVQWCSECHSHCNIAAKLQIGSIELQPLLSAVVGSSQQDHKMIVFEGGYKATATEPAVGRCTSSAEDTVDTAAFAALIHNRLGTGKRALASDGFGTVGLDCKQMLQDLVGSQHPQPMALKWPPLSSIAVRAGIARDFLLPELF